jgi:ATP-dependent helicase/nuclease subunit A
MSDAAARADAAQRRAADPAVSAFVAASAGSGKTKLLTDRLLRLMLEGADPGRIQCLTYTKAAAAEMALRLQRRLGRWVTLPDAALDGELAALGVAASAPLRAQARALFARVLDVPGGMRIETIHAFCQSLLRRFPLEARLSPHFTLLEDRDADLAFAAAQETVLAGAHEVGRQADLAALAGLITLGEFGELTRQIRGGTPSGAEIEAALNRALGGEPDEAARMARAVAWAEEQEVRDAARIVAAGGSPVAAARAQRMLDWLGLPPDERAENWNEWCANFLRADGGPLSPTSLVNVKLVAARPDLAPVFAAEQARIAAVEDGRRAAGVAALTAALVRLGGPVVAAFAAGKDNAGVLDFDDLIRRASALLVDPGAAWVLYKLDGGLDHLLLDEAQDTAPAQWAIAGALTAEFFAGAGAREGVRRSVFAVGDRKQSIFGFQGADPDAFDTWRATLRQRVADAGERFEDVALDVSFRSTAPVLALVDAVFAAPAAAEGVGVPGTLHHHAARAGHAGSVELWPLAPALDVAAPTPWQVPERSFHAQDGMRRLAEALAARIAAETAGTTMLESRGRPLGPGDVLVLVRRRNAFARALVGALKRLGVKVAGLDRMMLTEQPAVADLLALADLLLLPQDDLAVAAVLVSPLGFLDDASLMELAAYRRADETLWEALRRRAHERPEWQASAAMLRVLFARVDYVTPHALFAEMLGPLGGRARLLARLGEEAAEPIDELLNAALAYTAAHPPSLQGFLHWLRASGAEVKRQAEGAGDAVRVMTVHGAKGLQAPLVILPDTTGVPPSAQPLLWHPDAAGTLPVWVARAGLSCAAADRLRAAAARRRQEEYNRLLYVALTRAEDRLIVCGWQTGKTPADTCWYRLAAEGFARLGATVAADVTLPWEGEVWRHAVPQTCPPVPDLTQAVATPAEPLPAWAGTAPLWAPRSPPAEPVPPLPLAPSRPQDAALGAVPDADSPLTARDATGLRFRRGRLVHALLQHLPALPAEARPAAARRFLDRPGNALPAGEAAAIAADALAVLDHPLLAPLFGPEGRAEVPLTGVIGGRVVGGLVDRLAVLADRVLIADYKTSRTPPATPAEVPVLYLRQMAAYRAVLRAIHPGRPVLCALVWTQGARVMALPEALLDRHAPGAQPAS